MLQLLAIYFSFFGSSVLKPDLYLKRGRDRSSKAIDKL